MSAMTDYLENAIGNHILRNISYTSPSTLWCGLFTTAPTDAGGGTEVSGGSYARVQVTFSNPSTGLFVNSSDINFPQATANWGTIVAFAIFDGSGSSANMLIYGNLSSPKTVNQGDQFRFLAGNLQITFQ